MWRTIWVISESLRRCSLCVRWALEKTWVVRLGTNRPCGAWAQCQQAQANERLWSFQNMWKLRLCGPQEKRVKAVNSSTQKTIRWWNVARDWTITVGDFTVTERHFPAGELYLAIAGIFTVVLSLLKFLILPHHSLLFESRLHSSCTFRITPGSGEIDVVRSSLVPTYSWEIQMWVRTQAQVCWFMNPLAPLRLFSLDVSPQGVLFMQSL